MDQVKIKRPSTKLLSKISLPGPQGGGSKGHDRSVDREGSGWKVGLLKIL